MKRIEDVILFQLDQATKASKMYSQRVLDDLGVKITVEQWVLLKIISESTDLTQRELALKSSRDPASITRTLDILQKKGFISRESVPNNRRSYYIILTETGAEFIKANMKTIMDLRKKSVEGISQKDLEKLSELLGRIKQNME